MFGHQPRRTILISRAYCVAFLGCASIASRLAQSQTPPPVFDPPKQYYLALGDSIGYGYQSYKQQANLPPSGYNTGYVDLLAARVRELRPDIITINYSCPGESTETFVAGRCLWTELGNLLHDTFSGNQLDAAIAFLRGHRGQVSPVTLTLGSNDFAKLLGPCTFNGQVDLICVRDAAPRFVADLVKTISSIVERLRSAAPDTEIIVTGAWDSFLGALAFADPLFQAFNASLAQAVTANRARFADPFPIFNPQGDPAREVQALCALTLLCTNADSHPSDAGYRALAAVVFEASQYSRLR